MQAPELHAILQLDKLVIRPFLNKRKGKKRKEINLRIEIGNTDARDKM